MSPYPESDMFYGATPEIFENARILRNNQTPTEQLFWKYIRRKQLGFKFRRQHPISTYIADFYCHSLKLVIELDGGYHLDEEQKSADKNRTVDIEKFGIKVIRFTNDQVNKDIAYVLDTLKQQISMIK